MSVLKTSLFTERWEQQQQIIHSVISQAAYLTSSQAPAASVKTVKSLVSLCSSEPHTSLFTSSNPPLVCTDSTYKTNLSVWLRLSQAGLFTTTHCIRHKQGDRERKEGGRERAYLPAQPKVSACAERWMCRRLSIALFTLWLINAAAELCDAVGSSKPLQLWTWTAES